MKPNEVQLTEGGATKLRAGLSSSDCSEKWKKHRTLTRISWALFAAWIPYGILVFNIGCWAHSDYAGVAIILYFVAFMVISTRVSLFRCPGCGERFYAWAPSGLGHNSFARKCRNCGLRKWQCE
jgi:hypothetical protein